MATPIIMPRQGQSVESCVIAKWHKKKGERVEVGEILFSYETDKASFEEEAKVTGILLEIFYGEGDDVPCLSNVGVIGVAGESAAEFDPGGGSDGATEPPPSQAPVGQPDSVSPAKTAVVLPEKGDAPPKISPRARKLAERSGVDYRYASGSGPYGRIVAQDITALQENGIRFTNSALAGQLKGEAMPPGGGTGLGGRITTADLGGGAAAQMTGMTVVPTAAAEVTAQEYQAVKLTKIRRTIAGAMRHSLASTAQLTLQTSCDATDLLQFRNQVKQARERLGLENITLNDLIVFAVSRILPRHKELNAHLLEDSIRYFNHVNLGVAVDTERGLMVPTVFNAEQKSLSTLSGEIKRLIKDCQSGAINPDLLKDGTFTVTNLGTLGVESFTPILNPPQTGILGVNAITRRVREVDGTLCSYPVLGLSLTFDHRALDGAPAARFLQDLKDNLENFTVILAR